MTTKAARLVRFVLTGFLIGAVTGMMVILRWILEVPGFSLEWAAVPFCAILAFIGGVGGVIIFFVSVAAKRFYKAWRVRVGLDIR